MKKIITLFSIIILFSCRNDDNENITQTEATMVGKWSFQKVDIVKSLNGQTQTTENTECDKKTKYISVIAHIFVYLYDN